MATTSKRAMKQSDEGFDYAIPHSRDLSLAIGEIMMLDRNMQFDLVTQGRGSALAVIAFAQRMTVRSFSEFARSSWRVREDVEEVAYNVSDRHRGAPEAPDYLDINGSSANIK